MGTNKETSPKARTPLGGDAGDGFGHAWPLGEQAMEYVVDAWQRAVLYGDVQRQRGDQYHEHMCESEPNVLNFPSQLVMSGADLPRPVNYALRRILPQPGYGVDEARRPFVVIDPRAGHGPGIGGFKPDSEIGAAMRAGHPCYFVGFLPDPVPGQTVEDVLRAEAAFVQRVGELHPTCNGKPAVIGNCQAGWQILMAASLWPDLFGPIIVAGAPLSYWAGDNPMRYTGGLVGGSWLTALTSDLGAGRFDGAWLVQNFENLDPANTLWSKQYNLYANIDSEAPRYLGFEKFWGGYVFLNDVEMQYIVDNLFIGNKLATAELITSDGLRVDLRNIRSPIVVFSSYGDNITPPAQALGWVTDLYRNDEEVLSHNQTIIYATHDSVGHLGIFVSSSVGRKEHLEFANSIDLIDTLPTGIYQALIEENPDRQGPDDGQYALALKPRKLKDVLAIVKPDVESERRFSAAAKVSEINLGLYRRFMQPWVRSMVTPEAAQWMQRLHPLRVSYEWWSSHHPMADLVQESAERVREERRPVASDNPFIQAEHAVSDMVVQMLDGYRDSRDELCALLFDMIYGSPWVQALAGQSTDKDKPPRQHPGESPEHRAFVKRQLEQLRRRVDKGGVLEAGMRAIYYAMSRGGEVEERHFRQAFDLHPKGLGLGLCWADFRQLVRDQALIVRHERKEAIAAIPGLLAGAKAEEIRDMAGTVRRILGPDDELRPDERALRDEMMDVFERAANAAEMAARPAAAKKAVVKKVAAKQAVARKAPIKRGKTA